MHLTGRQFAWGSNSRAGLGGERQSYCAALFCLTARHTMDDDAQGQAEEERAPQSETRWPMAGAVIAIIVLTFVLPDPVRPGPKWLLPAIEGGLLSAVIASDPGRIDRRSRVLRTLSITLVAVLAAGSLIATGLLIDQLIAGGSITSEAGPLLSAGVRVWFGNGLAFALLFWELDGGGPAVRVHETRRYPDFAFPQHLDPDLAPTNWRPRFVDYLYLSLTNSVAFSPTDAMPLVPWAKAGMAVQSVVSFAIVGLVIARAVNVFS